MGDAIERGPASTSVAVKIADALDVSLDWLLTGRDGERSRPVAVDDADFAQLPRFDLRAISDAGRGDPVERVPFRRDWLYRRLLTSSDLWLTELPSSYEGLGLEEGDVVICGDINTGDGPEENWLCLFRGSGGIFAARYSNRPGGEEGVVTAADLADGDLHPVARIRARLMTRL